MSGREPLGESRWIQPNVKVITTSAYSQHQHRRLSAASAMALQSVNDVELNEPMAFAAHAATRRETDRVIQYRGHLEGVTLESSARIYISDVPSMPFRTVRRTHGLLIYPLARS